MFRISRILALGAVVSLSACASGGDDANGSDATGSDIGAAPINTYVDEGQGSQDTGILTPPGQDNGTSPSVDNGSPVAPENCDYNGMNLAQQSAELNEQYQVLLYSGATSANPPADSISIEIYQSAEFGGPTTPGTYNVDGANYSDCGLCVRIYKNISQGGAAPEKEFFADKGSVTITSIGDDGRVTGTFNNLELKEVTIDSNTWVSTPVPGGETWCMSNVPFDAEVKTGGGTVTPGELPVADASVTQASCVPEGNGHWVNNNVADFTLTNCNGDPVSLHSMGCDGETKAIYIVSTAGWCPACKQLIGGLKNQWSPGDMLTQADVEAAVPGLKLLIVLAENQSYGQPTEQYCKQYAAGDGVDPAMIVMDFNPAGLTIPLAAPQGSAFSTESMATTWSSINPYLVADSQGQIMSGFPWEAVLRAGNMSYVYSSFFDQTKYADYYINQVLNE
jgi:hypothetical protein